MLRLTEMEVVRGEPCPQLCTMQLALSADPMEHGATLTGFIQPTLTLQAPSSAPSKVPLELRFQGVVPPHGPRPLPPPPLPLEAKAAPPPVAPAVANTAAAPGYFAHEMAAFTAAAAAATPPAAAAAPAAPAPPAAAAAPPAAAAAAPPAAPAAEEAAVRVAEEEPMDEEQIEEDAPTEVRAPAPLNPACRLLTRLFAARPGRRRRRHHSSSTPFQLPPPSWAPMDKSGCAAPDLNPPGSPFHCTPMRLCLQQGTCSPVS
jgi:hypothetical protein